MHVSVFDLSTVGYLGLRHTSEELRPWDCLGQGRPRHKDEDDSFTDTFASRLATLQSCEKAIFSTSTFQLFWDFFGLFSGEEIIIYHEEDVYPTIQWGVERANHLGVPSKTFQDLESLNVSLSENSAARKRPLVVIEGINTTKWVPNQLSDYLIILEPYGGFLVVDDTQALGILGSSPNYQFPFGLGGGGSIRWHGLDSSNVILISSLAKGFGVPIAALSGSKSIVDWFLMKSQTREHCSPPCTPLLHAVEHVLDINELEGDKLRDQLVLNILTFQTIIKDSGFMQIGSLFPIQIVLAPELADPEFLMKELQARGIQALIQSANSIKNRSLVAFGITSAHSKVEIELAAHSLVEILKK